MPNQPPLTNHSAVDAAIEEFDRIGRDAFLHKYGFGESKDYFLLTENGRYDTKPLYAAACLKQHGVALGPDDFNGGRHGAGKWLSDLGYTVEGLAPKAGRKHFDSFDTARGHLRLPSDNLAFVRDFMQGREYEDFFIPASGPYIAMVPRDGGAPDLVHSGYIWTPRPSHGDDRMLVMPVNKVRGSGGNRRAERPAPTCPQCGNVLPLSGQCDFCG